MTIMFARERHMILTARQVQALLLCPVCPHTCEHVWALLGKVTHSPDE